MNNIYIILSKPIETKQKPYGSIRVVLKKSVKMELKLQMQLTLLKIQGQP